MSIYNAKATVKGKIHKVKEKCDKNLNNMNLANMNPAVFREPVFFTLTPIFQSKIYLSVFLQNPSLSVIFHDRSWKHGAKKKPETHVSAPPLSDRFSEVLNV